VEKSIEQLLQKYLTSRTTEKELSLLKDWISEGENRKLLEEYFEMQFLLTNKYKCFDDGIALKKFMETIESRPKIMAINKRKYTSFIKYAAVFVGILTSIYVFKDKIIEEKELLINEEEITLQLDNGKVEVLSASDERQITDRKGIIIGVQKGNKISYSQNLVGTTVSSDKEELVYNELTVPYGKTFELALSDGTDIHLNAGTSIKYPVQFIKGKERQVFIKNGEVYFDVAKDEEHPFVVNVEALNVRVLGTKFNVSFYPEDESVNTVLVEGSVGLYEDGNVFNKQESAILEPGYKAAWNVTNKKMVFHQVDTDVYTGWIEGKIIFKDTPFKNIRKKLERHYNVSIKNYDKKLDENTYSAVFDVESIEKVLETLNESYPIKYTIIKNEIIIN